MYEPHRSKTGRTTNLASCIVATVFLLFLAAEIVVVYFLLFKLKDPKIAVDAVQFPTFPVANGTVDFTFLQYVTVSNPNRDAFTHYDSSLQLAYSDAPMTYFKDVEKQLMHKLGDEEAMQLLSRAVYFFSIGGNDYGSLANYSGSRDEIVEMVIGNLTVVIKEIYEQGGRNFGFLGVAAVGCLPFFRSASGHCNEELATLVKLHNEALHNILHKLDRQLKGFRYSYFDFYTVSLDLIENPSKYGLKEGKSACCGSGPYRGIFSCGGKRGIVEYKLCANASEYVYFDSIHPSEAANHQVAKLIWSGNRTIAWPYNLKNLFKA
ncbi:hypothetical protein RJ640_023664 [Escallonia rubra]|uniref:GDSL esterase/lipase 1-like n=1 Tax=Escallonia rubra TaxID=112253 RepID=A0AA88R041_9ASTE|nr:hypothetical protein RJ640_023664 [Escallonia rubra]